jgi:3',5'-cyclic AMP phosphodiesterase CpdA
MKLLILADLHAFQGERKPLPSLVNFSDADRTASSDPLLGLRKLFQENEIEVPDLLLCAGDLADRADPIALKSAWSELASIQADFEIPHFVATCGNHDLDSRCLENRFDPKGYLRKLVPSFPLPGYGKNDVEQLKYWSNNFSIVEGPNWRILTINSCAYHGYGPDSRPELDHGRISHHTLDEIRSEIKALDGRMNQKFNICLVHHHLREMRTDAHPDKSRMQGSEDLLGLLSQAEFGEWFVVHGHVHRGEIYGERGNSGPIVLSCASFSVSLAGDHLNPSANQFYVVEFDQPAGPRHRIRGQLKAWDWSASYGWQQASVRKGSIGPISGFGFRGDIPSVAEKIMLEVRAEGKITWSSALSSFSELKHFLPSDRDNLVIELEADGDIKVSREGETPREIVLK